MSQRDRDYARAVVVSIRLTPREAAHIDAAGAALNYPRQRADFVRAAALSAARQKAPPPTRIIRCSPRRKPTVDVEQLTRILGRLGKLGASFNQLTANGSQNPSIAGALKVVAQEIAAIRGMVSEALRGRDRDH